MEQRGAHEAGGRAWGGRRTPLPRGFLEASLTWGPSLLDHVRSKNHVPEGFNSVWTPLDIRFCETLK